MKAYPITEDELETLGLLQAGSTASFSLASFLGSFCLSVKQGIAFADKSKPSAQQWWDGIATGAGWFALALALLGAYLIWRGRTKIGKLKKDTSHG